MANYTYGYITHFSGDLKSATEQVKQALDRMMERTDICPCQVEVVEGCETPVGKVIAISVRRGDPKFIVEALHTIKPCKALCWHWSAKALLYEEGSMEWEVFEIEVEVE